MITEQNLKENQIHVNSEKAKKSAKQFGVFVCTNKEKNEFEFVPLEEVIYEGKPLKDVIEAFRSDIRILNEENHRILSIMKSINDQVNKGKAF
jgi:hypothetical protein